MGQQPGLSIVGVATQGKFSGDYARLQELLMNFPVNYCAFEKKNKLQIFVDVLRTVLRQRPDLVFMEGTGIAGGLALILARLIKKIPYVISSGDAVGPYIRKDHPYLGVLFSIYERILCRLCAGYIGWTPYLAGRALTFGAQRVMTAPGWAPFGIDDGEKAQRRVSIRSTLGISAQTIVVGIVGSLNWNHKIGYCYGYELVQALRQLKRRDVVALIVGDGSGRRRLAALAGADFNQRIFFTGHVEREQVPWYLAAMDVVSLPQSVDRVGGFRYTTKISEYMAAQRPVITGPLPFTYDLDGDWFWRLAGTLPWSDRYVKDLANLLEGLCWPEILDKQRQFPIHSRPFDKAAQVHRVTEFIQDLCMQHHAAPSVAGTRTVDEEASLNV